MPHPIPQEDYERFAIHEASHAVVAALRGFRVLAIRLDGPADNPGANWNLAPNGQSAENNPVCARNQVAIYSAGHLAEEKRYPQSGSRANWKGLDLEMCRYCALQALGDEADFAIAQQVGPNYDLWPQQNWNWEKFQNVIEEEEAAVRLILDKRWEQVLAIAKRLLDPNHNGRMWGEEVYEILELSWPGEPL